MKSFIYLFVTCYILLNSDLSAQNSNSRMFSKDSLLVEFSITNKVLKNIKQLQNKKYFWYRANNIHYNIDGYTGKLLNGIYKKSLIKSKKLIEYGTFKNGLKNGVWKKWFANGRIKNISNWKKGYLDGNYFLFDEKGNFIVSGHYLKNKKTGKWINYKKKDTILYKNGKIKESKTILSLSKKKKKIKEVKKEKKSFFKRLFSKRSND